MKPNQEEARRLKPVVKLHSLRTRLGACLCACVGGMTLAAQAGLTLDLQLVRYNYEGGQSYYFSPYLSTNAAPPDLSPGTYFITSPNYPASGQSLTYVLTNGQFNLTSGGGTGYNAFDEAVTNLTGTNWAIWVTNSIETNVYYFEVMSSLASNDLPGVAVTFPLPGALNVTNRPACTWSGPANFDTLNVTLYDEPNYNQYQTDTLSPSATAWTPPNPLADGTNDFFVRYGQDASAAISATTPRDVNSNALTAWVSGASLVSTYNSQFVVGSPRSGGVGTGHTNLAYYSFEDHNLFAQDFSGHGNNIDLYVNTPFLTNDAAAGTYAFGAGTGWLQPPTNVLNTLAGSFSISLWLKTTNVPGSDNDSVYAAAGIVSALSGGSHVAVPMGQTGNKLIFYTAGDAEDTLYSASDITTGDYLHVVVTRNQATGEKKIYINGVLDASSFGPTNWLGDATEVNLGCNNGNLFQGELDDIQFYSGVLSAAEVVQLFDHPGTTIPDVTGGGNGLLAHYDFDEGATEAPDVSGNGNDLVASGAFAGSGPVIDTNAIAGLGAVSFDGGSYLTAPAGMLPALADSFTVSVWINTVQDTVTFQDYLDAAGIIAADIPGDYYNDVMPVGMDEFGEIVFNTGDDSQGDDEMYSWTTVNDGNWHHVVVTRDRTTGEKNIYIDGVLDDSSPEYGSTNLLSDPALLTIGALADASVNDPHEPDQSGNNGFEGLIDDIQIYPRVLNPGEVAYLHDNPGATLGAVIAPPVDVEFGISIVRDQTYTSNDSYYCFPSLFSVSEPAITEHTVESPHNWFHTSTVNGGGSYIEPSLDAVINECTNGFWKLYINKGAPGEQLFTFKVMITGLDTNLLAPAVITSPANGTSGIATSPAFAWSGPAGFSGIFVQTYRPAPPGNFVSTNLPGTATNWPAPPVLEPGTNRFYISYHTNDVPFISTTIPQTASATPIHGWTASAYVNSDATSEFVVTGAATPVQLTNVQRIGNLIQFAFLTESGRTNIIEARTNLTSGMWVPLTNVIGDGTMKQFLFSSTNPPVQFFRVNTQ